jgi:hypothetical protein
MTKAKLLNFRCPDELWAEIEKIGGERHPVPEGKEHQKTDKDNPKKFAVTATVLDILWAGIATLSDNPAILDKTDSKTVDKTDIQRMINEAIAALDKSDTTATDELIEKRVKESVSKAIGTLNNDLSELMVEVEDIKKPLALG